MGQVTIYLENELEEKMRSAAKAKNLSRSRWIANAIREKLRDEWPAEIVALADAWGDLPLAEEIRAD